MSTTDPGYEPDDDEIPENPDQESDEGDADDE
jgi:hypothetical protein